MHGCRRSSRPHHATNDSAPHPRHVPERQHTERTPLLMKAPIIMGCTTSCVRMYTYDNNNNKTKITNNNLDLLAGVFQRLQLEGQSRHLHGECLHLREQVLFGPKCRHTSSRSLQQQPQFKHACGERTVGRQANQYRRRCIPPHHGELSLCLMRDRVKRRRNQRVVVRR